MAPELLTLRVKKGMMSDALKRAAVRWGVGRYLYELKSPWVAIEARGRSFIIPMLNARTSTRCMRTTA
jgi:hypothetical protein